MGETGELGENLAPEASQAPEASVFPDARSNRNCKYLTELDLKRRSPWRILRKSIKFEGLVAKIEKKTLR